jgi:spoIIIJ-associated protein
MSDETVEPTIDDVAKTPAEAVPEGGDKPAEMDAAAVADSVNDERSDDADDDSKNDGSAEDDDESADDELDDESAEDDEESAEDDDEESDSNESDDDDSDSGGESGGERQAGVVAASDAGGHETDLDTEGDIAADYLEEFLDIVDLDGDIDTYTEGDRAHVSIVTESQVLVGRNGEVLDALQELARLAVLTETGRRSRLILDVGGHRDRRRKELLIMAHEAIAEVQASGEPVRLPVMNPFERKIVHDAVAEAGLVSESEGVEPQRRVVVSAK